jgi:SAM-dependent methyltransferase
VKETSKAMARRWQETEFPWCDIFKGKILDVGSGDDGLLSWSKNGIGRLTVINDVTDFDLPDGGGDDLTKFFPPSSFDTIHGSQVLEHALDPNAMLRSWLEVLRPGGYVVATVPDFELYEGGVWPSRWNAGHRSTWSMDKNTHPVGSVSFGKLQGPPMPIHIKLPEWLEQFPVEILGCRLVTTNFDFTLNDDVDQTFKFEDGVEVFLEFVIRLECRKVARKGFFEDHPST